MILFQNPSLKKKRIDFLNIDVEGSELEVLKSLNFKVYKPSLVCVEIHHKTKFELKHNSVFKFLVKKKYKKIWSKEYSFIFSRISKQ